jgi:hypothetical protein
MRRRNFVHIGHDHQRCRGKRRRDGRVDEFGHGEAVFAFDIEWGFALVGDSACVERVGNFGPKTGELG